MKKVRAALMAALVVTAVLVPGHASAQASVARIMLVGDSVTQGAAGDYTWRYRLWKTLQADDKAVDFVGPRTNLSDGTTSYADPDFDQDHAALWGALLVADGWWVNGQPEDRTRALVGSYSPDVVVDELGVNNLIYGATADQLITLTAGFVADVRAMNPHASVVLGQLTQTWFPSAVRVAPYNAALVDLAASLDQPDARVVVAYRPADYTEADTYDNSHPNAQGEIKLAQQYADALARLSLPDKPPPPPPPAPPTPAYAGAAHLAATSRVHGVRLDFTVPAGATRQAVWRRDRTAHGRWVLVGSAGPDRHRYRVGALRSGHRYAFRIRAYQGSTPSSVFSNVARARAR